MSLADLVGSLSKLQLAEGVEKDLRDRQRIGNGAIIVTAVVQVLLIFSGKGYLEKLGQFLANLLTLNWSDLLGGEKGLDVYTVIGVLVIVIGVGSFLLFRSTRFFLRESEKPFQYTFSVDEFDFIPCELSSAEMPGVATGQADMPQGITMLHSDLIEKLSAIGRLSLLDISSISKNVRVNSHIHIRGECAVRQSSKGSILQVSVRIRIGDINQPEKISPRVEVDVINDVTNDEIYRVTLEQVYARVATAIYKQIKVDVDKKVELFPSGYMKAVGQFNEAQDFEKSNTVDSYDIAIELYEKSINYFDTRFSSPFIPTGVTRDQVRHSQLIEARVRVAYARCLIFRKIVAELSGNIQDPLFHVPADVGRSVKSLQKLYSHACCRLSKRNNKNIRAANLSLFLSYPTSPNAVRGERKYNAIRRELFEALSAWSLALKHLGNIVGAKNKLKQAKLLAPDMMKTSALYLLAEAEIVANLHAKRRLLKNAIDRFPSFEILLSRLASCLDQQFRQRNELTPEKAEAVLSAYEAVQKINSGNIGAYAAYGYIKWLLEENAAAEKYYRKGLAIKTIRSHTFVGDLNYGLARIAAEAGQFNESFNLYTQALAAEPGVGTCSEVEGKAKNKYYDFCSYSTKERYRRFKENVDKKASKLKQIPSSVSRLVTNDLNDPKSKGWLSHRTLAAVQSRVLNDYGNASFQYYCRSGIYCYLNISLLQYQQAIDRDPDNAVAYFNRSIVLGWRVDSSSSHEDQEKEKEKSHDLEMAMRLEPEWRPLLIISVERIQAYISRKRNEQKTEKETIKQEITKEETKLNKLKGDLSFKFMRDDKLDNEILHLNEKEREARYREEGINGGENRGEKYKREINKVQDRNKERQKQITDWDNEKNTLSLSLEKNKVKLVEHNNKSEDFLSNQIGQLEPIIQRLTDSPYLVAFAGCVTVQDFIKQIPVFLQQKIRIDRLDRESAVALKCLASLAAVSWGAISSDDTSKDEHFRCADELYQYLIKSIFPEDFDLSVNFYYLYLQKSKMKEFVEAASIVRRAINDSLDEDPTHWNTLSWAKMFYDIDIANIANMDERILSSIKQELKDPKKKFVAVTKDLSDRFEECGVSLGKSSVENGSSESSLKITNWSDGAVYSLKSLGEGQNQISFDACRMVKSLKDALDDHQDSHDHPRTAVLHSLLGGLYKDLGRKEEAEKQFISAGEKDSQSWEYPNHLGNLYYENARYLEASENYRKALINAPDKPVIYSNLALALEESNDTDLLREASDALQKASELQPNEKVYAERLLSLKQKRKNIEVVGAFNLEKSFVVTPITVEVAAGLIPLVEGDGSSLSEMFSSVINNIRSSVKSKFGVILPGIIVRRNETDLPDNTYIIVIKEIPIVSGTLIPSKVVVEGSCESHSVSHDEFEETTHPDSGVPMCWLDRQEADSICQQVDGLEIYEPVKYLGWHLHATLRKNLPEFFGHQEAQDLFESSIDKTMVSDMSSDTRSKFVAVLRALLEEEVPVRDVEVLYKSYLVSESRGDTLNETVEVIRRLPQIMAVLPGANEECTLYELAEDIELIVENSMLTGNNATVLALEPNITQDILTAIRSRPSNKVGGKEAIVVRQSSIRRAWRKLVELEFPNLWIVSINELSEASQQRERLLIESQL